MTYTDIQVKGGRNYYYRAKSIRDGSKFKKLRKYMGVGLSKEELEEKEKSNLVNILLKNISEKELLNCLNILTIETTKIIEKYSIENLKKNDTKYHYFTKVAAGSAAISCYQAALALAANKDPNHIFISKFQLFKAGHWPLIVTDNSLNIF